MNVDLLKGARDSIKRTIDHFGGCDHSVGICCCEDIRIVEDLDAEIKSRESTPDASDAIDDFKPWGHLFFFPSNWGPGYVARVESGPWNGHNYVASQPIYTRDSENPKLPGDDAPSTKAITPNAS